MEIGDLIKFNDPGEPNDPRKVGTILGFDTYRSAARGFCEIIIEVLWNTGNVSWILQSRVAQINV